MTVNDKDKLLIEKFLKAVPLFRSFSSEHVRKLADDFNVISYKKGEDIVFQADEGTDLYIVLKGRVKVSLLSCDGEEFVLTDLKAGDFFGEMSLIDGRSRSANVITSEDASFGVLKREVMLDTLKQRPEISYDFLTALVERLRKSDDLIEKLAFLDVNERLLSFFVKTAIQDGKVDSSGCYTIKKLTHLELASHIGSSRESVSKVMKMLARNNVVTEEDGCLVISPDALKRYENGLC